MPLASGTEAPTFALPLVPGEAPLRLSDYRGHRPVVLLFYPLAFSPTCSEELREMADLYERWEDLDAEVIGISVDSPYVNQRFAEECGIPFPVLSDFNREVVSAYDVLNEDFFGLRDVAHRSAFVIDREGMIVYSWMADDSDELPDFEEVRKAVRGAARQA